MFIVLRKFCECFMNFSIAGMTAETKLRCELDRASCYYKRIKQMFFRTSFRISMTEAEDEKKGALQLTLAQSEMRNENCRRRFLTVRKEEFPPERSYLDLILLRN